MMINNVAIKTIQSIVLMKNDSLKVKIELFALLKIAWVIGIYCSNSYLSFSEIKLINKRIAPVTPEGISLKKDNPV